MLCMAPHRGSASPYHWHQQLWYVITERMTARRLLLHASINAEADAEFQYLTRCQS